MKYILIFVMFSALIMFPSLAGAGISFERTYGGTHSDQGYSVAQTQDNGYIVTGHTNSYSVGISDVYVIKTDSLGDTLWTKTFGDSGLDVGNSVIQTADGDYLITGSYDNYYSKGLYDVYLIKLDSSGSTLWTRTYGYYGHESGTSIIQNSDGMYTIAGIASSPGTRGIDIFLMKVDSIGDTLWTNIYNSSGTEFIRSFNETTDGGYIIVGQKDDGSGEYDVYLVKTDSKGNLKWKKTYGGTSNDIGNSVIQVSDGGYLISAYTESYGADSGNIWLIKTDSLGDTLWTEMHGGTGPDIAMVIISIPDNGYCLAGASGSYGSGLSDFYLEKTDSLCNTIWHRTYGGTEEELCWSAAPTSDGGFVMAGYTNSFGAGESDFYLIKTDSLGNVAGVEEQKDLRHKTLDLRLTIHPNPFTTSTTITLSSAQVHKNTRAQDIELNIYDVSGRIVRTFPSSLFTHHSSVYWDGTDNAHKKLAGGVYFLKFRAGDYEETKKLMLIR
jgi:hypothetical protein